MHIPANPSLRAEAIAEFSDGWPSGIAVSRSGRIFVSFPRLDPVAAPITLGEIVDGTVVPYPDELVNAIDPSDAQHRFVSVHGITMGPGHRLLVLDTAARSLDGCDPASAKLVVIDTERNAIVHGIGFPSDVVLPASYLNDLVVDYNRGAAGTAFITDSGRNGPNGIIVVDLASGQSWRRLSGHASVRRTPPAGFTIATTTGAVQAPPVCDGIALSPDGRTLYWTPLGTYDFFSIDTDIVCTPHADPEQIARHVVEHAARDFASDGLDCDREGRVYFTDLTSGAIRRWIPGEDRYETLLGGAGQFVWPDAVRLGPDRLIYVSDSQLNRAPMFTGGADDRERPYRLYRAAIDADPAQF